MDQNFQIIVKAIEIAGFATLAFIFMYYYHIRLEVEGYRAYYKSSYTGYKKYTWVGMALIFAFILKLFLSARYAGYDTDMNCFNAWADMIYDNGFSKFYYLDAFTDYPPGYMALLWIIALIKRMFSIESVTAAGRVLIKLFPVIADVAAGFFIYKIARNRLSEATSVLLAFTYALNPVIILDSSKWGQTDSVFTLFVFLTGYLCMEKKRIPAYFMFIIGVFIKPQTLIFAPILIWTIIEQVFMDGFDLKKIRTDLIGGLAAIGTFFLLILPFGMGKVISQYVDTLGSYEYCSVNAYNIWALFGKNWADQSGKFLFLEYRQWGMVVIFIAVALSGYVFFKMREDKSKYFISMAVVVSTMFLFSVRMHERYLFPVIILVLGAFLVKPTRELLFTYVGFSFVQFLNVYHVIRYYEVNHSTGPTGGFIGFCALLTMGVYGYMFFAARSTSVVYPLVDARSSGSGALEYIKKNSLKTGEWKFFDFMPFRIKKSIELPAWNKWDTIVLVIIGVIYSCFALYDLGGSDTPVSMWKTKDSGAVITLDLGEQKKVQMLKCYLGNYENRTFTLDFSQDGISYETVGDVSPATGVFSWGSVAHKKGDDEDDSSVDKESYRLAKNYRYIRLTNKDNECTIGELVICGDDGEILMPVNTDEYPELFDEPETYVTNPTFRDGTYFDEIYHARTAYEMIEGIYCYENTHPPLGKFFISIGMRLFGVTPFGWRIVGVLFGIGMLPFMYVFGRRLFGGATWAAGTLTALFAFDFMHFVQTRISTIDVYGTFFIIAMYFFMYKYAQTSFFDNKLSKTFIPLGLSAVMMGLGCASKWTAVYAAAGLGIFFFAIMAKRFMEYKIALSDVSGQTDGISHAHIVEVYKGYLIKTLIFCVVFFILIAGSIYLASYIPFHDAGKDYITNEERFSYLDEGADAPDGENGYKYGAFYRTWAHFLQGRDDSFHQLVGRMLKNQSVMYHYHADLEATHPYSSTWYEWPTMIRPMFYYCKTVDNDLREGISAFGNPLVWWAGIPVFIYMLIRTVRRRDRTAGFLCYAYLVQYVPWILVPRCTFAYHYFPSVPFVAMMIAYVMKILVDKDKRWLKWVYVYVGAAFVLFLVFYPVLSGQPIEYNFARDGLKWLPDWVLVL